MKTENFPAGHSMDTNWFAVDKDGNIAFFKTGFNGNLPLQIPEETFFREFFMKYCIPITPGLKQLFLKEENIEKILKKCNTEILTEIIDNEEEVAEGHVVLLNEGKTWEDLDLEIVFAEEEYDFALLLSPKMPLFLLTDMYDIRQKLIKAIKNNIIIKACEVEFYIEDGDEVSENRIGLTDLGAYVYDHNEYDETTEPYHTIASPQEMPPLNISQFLPETKDNIPNFKEISFEERKLLQPLEFVPCKTYGKFYVPHKEVNGADYVLLQVSENEKAYCLLNSDGSDMPQKLPDS
jgi:hypothetical protein